MDRAASARQRDQLRKARRYPGDLTYLHAVAASTGGGAILWLDDAMVSAGARL